MDEILREALQEFADSDGGTSFNRDAAKEDIQFARLGVQWPAQIAEQRRQEGRPCLVINKLPSFIRQVVNDARQNKPAISVIPVEDADIETADVISGLIRQIERNSNADVAYDTALDNAVTCGFGFFRVGIDYCNYSTFDMEVKIERVANPLSVHWDPNTMAYDSSDWEYAFVSDMIRKEDFKRKWPKAEPVDFDAIDDVDYVNQWVVGDQVRLAEYFKRSQHKKKIYQLSDFSVMDEEELKAQAQQFFTMLTMQDPGKPNQDMIAAFLAANGLEVKREREADYYKVKRRIMSGVEILEETDWPGQQIPICPVWGEEVIYEGQRWLRSMIRDARDPQAMFNFWRSASTELVALSPRAPFLVAKGGIPKNEEQKWQSANNRSWPYLVYDPEAGPMPQRQPFAGPAAGALQEALNASDDIKNITGLHDASLGARSNETSGKAILARQREGDISTYHFIDNLSRAIQSLGKILVEIIPSVYSQRETIRILGQDETSKVVKLATNNGAQPEDGQPLYDISVGRYDVAVKAGPSFTTQREETREMLVEIMSRVPGSAAVIGDKLLEMMDVPGAEAIAQRLKLLLPPKIQMAEGIQNPMPNLAQNPQAPLNQVPVNPPSNPQGIG